MSVTERCGFCGKVCPDGKRMMAGAVAFICEACVDVCVEILAGKEPEPGQARRVTFRVQASSQERPTGASAVPDITPVPRSVNGPLVELLERLLRKAHAGELMAIAGVVVLPAGHMGSFQSVQGCDDRLRLLGYMGVLRRTMEDFWEAPATPAQVPDGGA